MILTLLLSPISHGHSFQFLLCCRQHRPPMISHLSLFDNTAAHLHGESYCTAPPLLSAQHTLLVLLMLPARWSVTVLVLLQHEVERKPTARISSVVSVSVARAEPSASRGSSPRVIRHWRAGPSPEHVHVRLSVVSTGTATVSTGIDGRYLATSRAVLPPLVRTTISAAWTCTVLSSGVASKRIVFNQASCYRVHVL